MRRSQCGHAGRKSGRVRARRLHALHGPSKSLYVGVQLQLWAVDEQRAQSKWRRSTTVARPPERPATITPEPFTPDSWREVGRALGASLLDVTGMNPWDRIKQSRYKNVQLARRFIEDQTVRNGPAPSP